MSRGVLMFAHNNEEIDYLSIACANALMVKKNLNVPVTLVTDNGSVKWAKERLGEKLLDSCFENIIIAKKNRSFKNKRTYSDTSFSRKTLEFKNCDHWDAYNLSPYEETLMIDADYLIMSPALNRCWGSHNDVMIDHRIYSPGEIKDPYTKYIDDFGIKLYWATVVYFKKTLFAETVFSIVKHVQENYEYYRDLYHFSSNMFRNDNAFSIAVHTLNGFLDASNSVVGDLPIKGLLMSWDKDDIHSIPAINDIVIYAEKSDVAGAYLLSQFKNTDIHIVNKWAISRAAERIIELYSEEINE